MPLKNRRIILLLMVMLFVTVDRGLVYSGPPNEGDTLPNFYLPVPDEVKYQRYLGLNHQSKFKVTEIKADVVIIQLFSMY